jgi:transcriptional regulator with XRE-family HTH domain
MDTPAFAEWFRKQLDRRGWSQADFARAAGLAHATVSTWYRGVRVPDPESCDRIADALHIDVETVLRMAGHLPPEPADDPPEVAELIAMLRRVHWNADRMAGLRAIVRGYLEMDRHLRVESDD